MIFSPAAIQKALNFAKKTAATYKAGQQKVNAVQKAIKKPPVKKPAPVRTVKIIKPAVQIKPVPAPMSPAPKPAPMLVPPSDNYILFGKPIKKSHAWLGGGLLFLTAAGIGYSTRS